MDRKIVYPGSIPLETDILDTNRNTLVALAKLAVAIFGTGYTVNGLMVNPTGPASLQVNVTPGEMYSLQNLDATAYSSLAADTAHQVLKQGILLDQITLNCPAPGTAGQSINYLIQASYSDVDGGAVALPYYNASNPSVAWSGPNNTGTQQNTVRAGKVTLTAKAGVAATTGTQANPSPDSGFVGLYSVTVANGQTQITASNIAKLYIAPFLPPQGIVGQLRSSCIQLTGSTSLTAAQAGTLIENGSGGGTVTLPAASPTLQGLTYYLSTPLSVSMTVATAGGAFFGGGISAGSTFFMSPNMAAIVTCDGASWIVLALSNGASSLAANGYQRLSSGLLIQWGAVTSSATPGSPVAVTFPIAFPTAGVSLTTSANAVTSSQTSSWIDSFTTTGFNLRCNVASTPTYYTAIGY